MRLGVLIIVSPWGDSYQFSQPSYGKICNITIVYISAWSDNVELLLAALAVLGFHATLTTKVISWRSVTHMCFLGFSHQC